MNCKKTTSFVRCLAQRITTNCLVLDHSLKESSELERLEDNQAEVIGLEMIDFFEDNRG